MRYVSKFFLEILPSVVATVVGAYIVNHYIIPKAGGDAPKAAAYSKASPENHEGQGATHTSPKPEAASSQEKPPQDKQDKPSQDTKAQDPKEKTPTETVKVSPEGKRPGPRERAIVKSASPAPTEAAPVIEERRDANELARAAIERLRTSTEQNRSAGTLGPVTSAPVQEAREPARNVVVVSPPPEPRPFVHPIPPPVSVPTSAGEGAAGNAPASVQPSPPYQPAARSVEANRPIPPADVPSASRPLDLQATAAPKPSVADDVLSAARSMINAVVPQ